MVKKSLKNGQLKKSFLLSYFQFFLVIVVSVLLISITCIISTKKELTSLGEKSLKNRVNMGITMMESLQEQIEKGVLTRKEGEEIFRTKMLNDKKEDGKTRGLNENLELDIGAYMYAINSKGIEMMHPFKEGEDISKVEDARGENVTNLIISEGNNPKNNGIINFWWKNPEEKTEKAKVNAVAYFEPWDWYINVGCYKLDFYKSIYKLVTFVICTSLIIILISFLIIKNLMRKKINPLSDIVDAMESASQGIVNKKVKVKNKDEIGYIAEVFNKMIEQIRNILLTIKELSSALDEKSTNINFSTDVTLENSRNIKEAMEGITIAINDSVKDIQNSFQSIELLSTNIDLIKENSIKLEGEASQANMLNSNIADILKQLENQTKESIDVSKNTNNNIKELLEKSKGIMGIVSTIEEISKEINLLSLNASIESARAGEEGRGFAVVANQIKKLSNDTSNSVKEINKLITEVIKVINVSVQSVEKSTKVAESEVETINKTKNILGKVIEFINKMPLKIQENVEKIEKVFEEKAIVTTSMESVLSVTEEITASSEEITASTVEAEENSENVKELAKDLENFSRELNENVNRFVL